MDLMRYFADYSFKNANIRSSCKNQKIMFKTAAFLKLNSVSGGTAETVIGIVAVLILHLIPALFDLV
jgi:hypothetical protein